VLGLALLTFAAIWCYGLYCLVQAYRHRTPGATHLDVALLARGSLTPRGERYQRHFLISLIGGVAVIVAAVRLWLRLSARGEPPNSCLLRTKRPAVD
jgi:hypothetical protein